MTQALADLLTEFAEDAGIRHLSAIIARVRRPLRVALTGRSGVGRGKVALALRRRGVLVADPGAPFDVLVLVVAEWAKPEELDVLAGSRRPSLIVLTKADLSGAGPGGPIAVARRRAAALEASTGMRAVPVVGLLAALDAATSLDGELVAGLQSFLTRPADLSSVDAFVESPHPVARDVRARLLATLDRFGIAHAVLALADGLSPVELGEYLYRQADVAGMMAALDAASAPERHRRVRAALVELRSAAIISSDSELARLLAADPTALAAMSAAVEVLEAEGLDVDRHDTAAAHLDRAVRWRRYGDGPVNALHRGCADDVVRGSLRLLAAVERRTG